MIDLEFLAKVNIFTDLSHDEIKFVSNYLLEKKISANEYIITDNTKGHSLYILNKGNVKVTKQLTLESLTSLNEEKQLAKLDASFHPSFGENGIVGAGKRTANVITISDCVVYQLTKESFDKIADSNIKIAFSIIQHIARNLANHLKNTDENLVKLATALSLTVGKKRN